MIVDYKLGTGVDCSEEYHPVVPPSMDMESVVCMIVEEMAWQGKPVTAVVELQSDFIVADGERATQAEIAANVYILYSRRSDLR